MNRNLIEVAESFSPQDTAGLDLSKVAGFSPVTRRLNAVQQVRLTEASRLWVDAQEGRIDPYLLSQAFQPSSEFAYRELCNRYPHVFRETMTVSDFSMLTDQILDRTLLANYQVLPPIWNELCKVRTDIKDFRAIRLYGVDGGQDVLEEVGELEGFNRRTVTHTPYNMSVKKYAAGFSVSWETLINDDLGAFADLPQRCAVAAHRSVSKYVTGLYVDASGPHASLYTSGNANIVTSNPVLSIAALQTAFKVLGDLKDVDGHPIVIDAVKLVVPPALEVTARNILNATELRLVTDTSQGGTADVNLVTANWMRNRVNLVVDPYIPIIATSANGDTSWFLFANPNQGRPALMMGFLRGFAAPQLYRKVSNTMRVGGGVDQMHGDFETMSHEYKVVHVFGGTRVDPKYTVASNGSGS